MSIGRNVDCSVTRVVDSDANSFIFRVNDFGIQTLEQVQVRVVADGAEQVVLQTNVEMMRCSSVPS